MKTLLKLWPVLGVGLAMLSVNSTFSFAQSTSSATLYDVAADFSTQQNPNGVWSYGYETNLGGAFTLLGYRKDFWSDNGVPITSWHVGLNEAPAIAQALGPGTAISAGGQFVAVPGTLWFGPGLNGSEKNYGVIRFTALQAGQYSLETVVRPAFDGSYSGDCDFHILKNGSEVFGAFLPPRTATNQSDVLELAAGDTVDYIIGRGADGLNDGNALKLEATLAVLTNYPSAPVILQQPTNQTAVVGSDIVFQVKALGTEPLSYQWQHNGADIPGANGASLVLSNVQFADEGNYSVQVSNALGVTFSSQASLTVVLPSYDLTKEFSTASNPHGAWSYGWETELGGPMTLLTYRKDFWSDNGVPITSWHVDLNEGPAIAQALGPGTAISAGGQFVGVPGTLWFGPGLTGSPKNYGVVRFTAPKAGEYQLQTTVRPVFDGPSSSDCDFHILKNGQELFGVMLPPRTGTNYTNSVQLALGETIDYIIGRGDDGVLDGSALKLEVKVVVLNEYPSAPVITVQPLSQSVAVGANVVFTVSALGTEPLTYQWQWNGEDIEGATSSTLTLNDVQLNQAGNYSVAVSNALGVAISSEAALSVSLAIYDLAKEFSTESNPHGAWSYGWEAELGGPMTLLTYRKDFGSDNGVPITSWHVDLNEAPAIAQALGPGTAISAGGQFVGVPGTLWFGPGLNGSPKNYGVVRFTAQQGGEYRLDTVVRPVFDGSFSGDCDFHILKNGVEVFGAFLPPRGGTNYAASLVLAEGETLDYIIGRGADGLNDGSALKLDAKLVMLREVNTAPVIAAQPQSQSVRVGGNVSFAVTVFGTPPFSYQWQFNDSNIEGATGASLALSNVQSNQAGHYRVLVSNALGSARSEEAQLTVLAPSSGYNLSDDFSTNRNPAGVWSYGWKSSLDGYFARFEYYDRQFNWLSPEGAFLDVWSRFYHDQSAISHNASGVTVYTQDGQCEHPPGATVLWPGSNRRDDKYASVRFTAPASGTYLVEASVRNPIVGWHAGDTDFHVVKNGVEVFGAYLPVNSGKTTYSSGYTNTLRLDVGSTLDFLGGRGADEDFNGAALKIDLKIALIPENLPTRRVLERALADLIFLRYEEFNPDAGSMADAAIDNLIDSLQPGYWLDGSHLDPNRGLRAFTAAKAAVRQLAGLVTNQHSTVPAQNWQDVINQIVQYFRALAAREIQDAAQAGVNPRKIAEDEAELAAGDEDVANGRYAEALDHYSNAWDHIVNLRLSLTDAAASTIHLEFLGKAGETYLIQSSTNMVDWTTIGTCVATPEGTVIFDAPAPASPSGFYRVATP